MKINETFIRTSVNYGLNDFEVPDDVFDKVVEIKNNEGILPSSPICKKSLTQLQKCGDYLEYVLNENNQVLKINFNDNFICKKIKITAKENINAKVVLNFSNTENCFLNSFVKFECEKNSNIEAVILTDFEQTSKNVLTIENELQENANLKTYYVDFSCDYSVLRFVSNLFGDNAQSVLKNIYIGQGESKIDLNIAKTVYGKNCQCDIQTIGALFDKASKNYKGLIDFKKGSKGSIGDEKELALTFSKQTKSKALPLLLSHEEDVKGSHSSATGKFGDQTLFYVMSRGLTKKQAVLLLLKAKLSSITEEIFDQELKSEITEKLERRIKYEI